MGPNIVAGRLWRAVLGLTGALALPAAAPAEPAKRIVMVVQQAAVAEAVASDQLAAARLRAHGYQVKVIDQDAPSSAAAEADVILMSATISSNKVGGKYRDTPIPVVTWEAYILPHMGMAGKKENADFGTKERERWLWVVNTPHPASGGLRPGQVNVQKKNVPMGWGKPGLGASIIGTFPGEPDHAGAFVYEKGAMMDYENVAPARRGFIFVDTATFGDLNDDGLRVFDAMVAWAAEGHRR